jgi:hypothetical protein
MKNIILIVLLLFALFACTKNSSNDVSKYPTILMGKWVDAANLQDTLEVYKEGDKVIMFDNSLYLRTNLAIWVNYDSFKKEAGAITGDKIYLRPYKSTETFFPYYFKWIEFPTRFEMQVQAIRPYLSAAYNLTYVKVP